MNEFGRMWKDPETEQQESETTKQDPKTKCLYLEERWKDPETDQQESETTKKDPETEWVDPEERGRI